jgi:serine/threonine-protein kinase
VDGKCFLVIPKGSHVLRVIAGDMKISKNIEVSGHKVVDVSFNLERERRLRANAGGIELASAEEASVMGPLITTAGQEIDLARQAPAPRAAGSSPTSAALAKGSAQGTPPPTARGPSQSSPTGRARYVPVQELGRGAMGVVYKARDAVLEREVALKLISDEVRSIPQVLELFMQEARALAALNHPNIVSVYDQGFDEAGHAFMVMEFVEGTTLEAMLEANGGKLPLEQALPIAEQLCAGVAFAHGRRVIHRDIKPANIFISSDGIVKLGDFGLARVVRELRIQRTEIRGTPLYMAPEQIFGQDIDNRADLYAVACTIYEMLTGRPPFIEGDVLYHHVHTPPAPVTQWAPELPVELDGILGKCLEKKKEARPASADALRQALRPLLQRYS